MVVPSETLIEKLGATEIGPVAALGDALNGAETVLEEAAPSGEPEMSGGSAA